MSENAPESKTVAPLVNVALAVEALRSAMNRAPHLPGIVVLSGPSGYGKTIASNYAANKLKAYYVECKSVWTRKSFMTAVLKEMGIVPAKTVSEMVDQACEQLARSGRPLIIDETDHIADKGAIEIVRDLFEGSRAAILLIGEENLPMKLRKWERFHGRILEFVLAQPATLADARHLAKLYASDVTIADDLLKRVFELAKGSVRRIAVNLARIQEVAHNAGTRSMDLAKWGDRPLYTGEAPHRRAI